MQTWDTILTGATPRCSECGAEVLRQCPECGTIIPGYQDIAGYMAGPPDKLPVFCIHCGAPFPWLDRQGRVWQLENLLDDEQLDQATELLAREQLQALADPDLSDADQLSRWSRLRQFAPGLFEKSGARAVMKTLWTTAIEVEMKKLGV